MGQSFAYAAGITVKETSNVA
ncbi:membrane protein YoeI [Enterobacter cancerogenus]|uniref:Membrane protein YoeI n=1 Tax=Enterobacter cancerogenus TaxID=69218 RepID=A0AB38P7V8_9ENTR|nr:membrane protein YoeI [Enterobacter cancerogenus]MRG31966.1 membrane protein YoeI [Enterobacter cancerogenus]QGG11443.1 membrane protein YoeI [Enterobacter cancerogenus]QXA51759.1 membrane protein YoeI [Enterobacter cancerogenus]QZY39112.1 membrane protein YoeI [Enterobacter cancerogenus]